MTALPKHKTFNTGEISLMNQRALQQQGQRLAQLERRMNEAEKALLEVNARLEAIQKRGPGRPKGSKNKLKVKNEAAEATAPQGMAEGTPAQDGDVAD